MTSNVAGSEPLLRTASRPFPLPSSRALSQTFQHTPRSFPRQAFTQTPLASEISRDVSEPPFKKQRLEGTTTDYGNAAGGETLRPLTSRNVVDTKSGLPIGSVNVASKADRLEKELHARQTPPLPIRPGQNLRPGGVHQGRALAIERAATRDAVQVKRYVPEPPSSAPRFHKASPADFFPWTGDHPEDVLNELTTKSGSYDKGQVSQNESSTARPSVWSSLKHKSGLQILSSLLVSALDQRQVHGTITATSTFKPPPRVTLTDTKREAWLRDLANPSIPLRRLSRTIPHGIRGKILLDHCLGKDIPTSRALWLAKCVGANEIRAFKRKGAGGVFTVGGEIKWIKDWTTNVEQFLESIVCTCGSTEWRARANYGLHLASHLYSEHLLDQDHYHDWLMTSLQNSDLDNLPIWLQVVQTHRQEIIQHRRRGKRLAEATLDHIQMALLPDNIGVYGSVLQQLLNLLKSIMVSASACFLLPKCWDRYEGVIRWCIDQREEQLYACFERLSRRNKSLQSWPARQSRRPRTSRQNTIALLDGLNDEPNFGKIAAACLRVNDDLDVLVITCLEWSSSIYRHGSVRTYAAARLLRIWNKHGVELQQPILDFLAANPNPKGLRKRDIYRLLAELINSKHLSIGKYLQWLIARGTLHSHGQPGRDGPCDVRLLFELPLHGLPNHVLNLRQTLLATLGASTEEEDRMLTAMKAKVAHQIPDFFSQQEIPPSPVTWNGDYVLLSQTVKSAVARWIRQTFILRLQSRRNSGTSESEDADRQITDLNRKTVDIISLAQLQAVRRILEEIQEFTILADILIMISHEVNSLVLTAATDTINHYFDVFYAIGATNELFQNLYQKFENHNGHGLVQNAFLEALIDLGSRLPDTAREVSRLQKEISAHVSGLSGAACSPISDNMVEAVQAEESTFSDEMEQLLASGTSMDKQTLTRVFSTITSHLEKSGNEPDPSRARFAQLLARLRGFGPKKFDTLVNEWLQKLLRQCTRPNLSTIVPPVICFKVVSLKTVLDIITSLLHLEDDQDHMALLASDTLDLISKVYLGPMPIVEYPMYRMLNQSRRLIRTSPASVVPTLRVVIEACVATDLSTRNWVRTQIKCLPVKALVHSILLQQAETAKDAELMLGSFFLDPDIQNAIGGILYQEDQGDFLQLDLRTKIWRVLDNMSEFNIPLAELELKMIMASTGGSFESTADFLPDMFIEHAYGVESDRIELWACLVSKISLDQAASIRQRAESELLSEAFGDTSSNPANSDAMLNGLISIVEAATFSIPDGGFSPLVEQIADGLTSVLPLSRSGKVRLNEASESNDMYRCLGFLLRMLIVHQSAVQHPRYPQNNLFRLLMSLSLILIHSPLNSHLELNKDVFDVLTLFSDSLSEDTRSRCIQSLRDRHRTRDPRLRFIFGYSETVESEWLQLVMKSSAAAAEIKAEEDLVATAQPYPLRRWEMMQDATPVATENDTSLSLTLFGAKKSVL